MGCAPSSEGRKEEQQDNRLEIKLPSEPVVIPKGFTQYNSRQDGAVVISHPRRSRKVPVLGKIDESQIFKRRETLKKVSSLPELSHVERSFGETEVSNSCIRKL